MDSNSLSEIFVLFADGTIFGCFLGSIPFLVGMFINFCFRLAQS